MFSLNEIFALLYQSVGNVSTDELCEKCRELGMVERPYVDPGMDQGMPKYEGAYWFACPIEGGHEGNFEILEAKEDIVQAGIQVVFRPGLFFSKASRFYKTACEIAQRTYGLGAPMNMGPMEIYNFGNSESICYVSKGRGPAAEFVTIRVGNRKFWNSGDTILNYSKD
jgi:hypothetical protein